MNPRHMRALLVASAALALAACGPTQPVGSNVVSATTSAAAPATKVSPANFKLGAKILEQSCFGSAGCNVSYRLQVLKAPKGGSWEVTYDVPDVEDGPKTGSVQIDDGQVDAMFPLEDFAQFKRKVKAVRIVVTSIEAR